MGEISDRVEEIRNESNICFRGASACKYISGIFESIVYISLASGVLMEFNVKEIVGFSISLAGRLHFSESYGNYLDRFQEIRDKYRIYFEDKNRHYEE